MESKKINQLATELSPDLSDLTIIGDPTTGISKKITLSQMASLFTGTVEEYANFAAFPLVGVADTIYVAKDTNVIYRWDSTAYVVLSPNIIASLVFNDANGFDGTISLVGSVATLTITTALTTGSVGFIGASGALLQDNANFFWDDTNNRLGLGTNAPTTALDVFGSGIIGRINGTSTNNAYLGFSSAGTNKWSVGNVQSNHRFRIFSEANSAELITILQTGEFGIGIANPTTKFHIDGGASALIANLDANVSVAKSISFRSDNSARMSIEVSGTESGANTGAKLFFKRFSDAGAFIDTPFEISRETGQSTFFSNYLFLAKNQNGFTSFYIENTTGGTASGGSYLIRSDFGSDSAEFGKFSTLTTAQGIISPKDAFIKTENGSIALVTNSATGTIKMAAGNSSTAHLTIASTGAATFSGSVTASQFNASSKYTWGSATDGTTGQIATDGTNNYFDYKGSLIFRGSAASNTLVTFTSAGAATFSSSVTTNGGRVTIQGTNQNTLWFNQNAGGTSTGFLVGRSFGSTDTQDFFIYDIAAAATRLFISSGGNVGIGTSSPTNTLHVSKAAYMGQTWSNTAVGGISAYLNVYDTTYGVSFGTEQSAYFQFVTNAAERMRITSGGNVLMGTSTDVGSHGITKAVSVGTSPILQVFGNNSGTTFFNCDGNSSSAANTGMRIGQVGATGRSINAGGTINASGADYAEYMLKAITDNILKGDIVGVNAEGKLTNIFDDSISFVVKSTNPSYVGGDTWGNSDAIGIQPIKEEKQTEEEYEQLKAEFQNKLEEARSKVDRIAFSGQVPCNVFNSKVGDYIIPINNKGKINGQAVTKPTFEQYQISVGRVWKIMEDGRAWIAVKIG